MSTAMLVAMIVGIPVILFPAAFIWYMNISGLFKVMREARQREKRQALVRKERAAA